jgi:hypothetical protein
LRLISGHPLLVRQPERLPNNGLIAQRYWMANPFG